jgi:hypothetical protein
MKILVTGTAGFIGSAVALRLLERGEKIVGVDNMNDYYGVALKKARLERLAHYPRYLDVGGDIADRGATWRSAPRRRVGELHMGKPERASVVVENRLHFLERLGVAGDLRDVTRIDLVTNHRPGITGSREDRGPRRLELVVLQPVNAERHRHNERRVRYRPFNVVFPWQAL